MPLHNVSQLCGTPPRAIDLLVNRWALVSGRGICQCPSTHCETASARANALPQHPCSDPAATSSLRRQLHFHSVFPFSRTPGKPVRTTDNSTQHVRPDMCTPKSAAGVKNVSCVQSRDFAQRAAQQTAEQTEGVVLRRARLRSANRLRAAADARIAAKQNVAKQNGAKPDVPRMRRNNDERGRVLHRAASVERAARSAPARALPHTAASAAVELRGSNGRGGSAGCHHEPSRSPRARRRARERLTRSAAAASDADRPRVRLQPRSPDPSVADMHSSADPRTATGSEAPRWRGFMQVLDAAYWYCFPWALWRQPAPQRTSHHDGASLLAIGLVQPHRRLGPTGAAPAGRRRHVRNLEAWGAAAGALANVRPEARELLLTYVRNVAPAPALLQVVLRQHRSELNRLSSWPQVQQVCKSSPSEHLLPCMLADTARCAVLPLQTARNEGVTGAQERIVAQTSRVPEINHWHVQALALLSSVGEELSREIASLPRSTLRNTIADYDACKPALAACATVLGEKLYQLQTPRIASDITTSQRTRTLDELLRAGTLLTSPPLQSTHGDSVVAQLLCEQLREQRSRAGDSTPIGLHRVREILLLTRSAKPRPGTSKGALGSARADALACAAQTLVRVRCEYALARCGYMGAYIDARSWWDVCVRELGRVTGLVAAMAGPPPPLSHGLGLQILCNRARLRSGAPASPAFLGVRPAPPGGVRGEDALLRYGEMPLRLWPLLGGGVQPLDRLADILHLTVLPVLSELNAVTPAALRVSARRALGAHEWHVVRSVYATMRMMHREGVGAPLQLVRAHQVVQGILAPRDVHIATRAAAVPAAADKQRPVAGADAGGAYAVQHHSSTAARLGPCMFMAPWLQGDAVNLDSLQRALQAFVDNEWNVTDVQGQSDGFVWPQAIRLLLPFMKSQQSVSALASMFGDGDALPQIIVELESDQGTAKGPAELHVPSSWQSQHSDAELVRRWIHEARARCTIARAAVAGALPSMPWLSGPLRDADAALASISPGRLSGFHMARVVHRASLQYMRLLLLAMLTEHGPLSTKKVNAMARTAGFAADEVPRCMRDVLIGQIGRDGTSWYAGSSMKSLRLAQGMLLGCILLRATCGKAPPDVAADYMTASIAPPMHAWEPPQSPPQPPPQLPPPPPPPLGREQAGHVEPRCVVQQEMALLSQDPCPHLARNASGGTAQRAARAALDAAAAGQAWLPPGVTHASEFELHPAVARECAAKLRKQHCTVSVQHVRSSPCCFAHSRVRLCWCLRTPSAARTCAARLTHSL